jgi:hypothetical protein
VMTEAFSQQQVAIRQRTLRPTVETGAKTMSAESFSGWPVERGIWWIQTREPRLARKLSRRSDTRLVAAGVSGGFLRVFEIRRPPSFVRRLIARYKAANARFRDLGNA